MTIDVVQITKNYGLITSIEQLSKFIDKLIVDGRVVSVDIETGYDGPAKVSASLRPEDPASKIVGISFTNSEDWARYVPLGHDLGNNLDNTECAILFWKLFHSVPIIAFNHKFELRFFRRWFMRWLPDNAEAQEADWYYPAFSDPMIEAYIAQIFPQYGLKFQTKSLFGHEQADIMSLFPGLAKNKAKTLRFNSLTLEPHVVSYACEDAVWALAVHNKYYPRVKDRFIFKTEMQVLPIVCRMEDYGVRYDWAAMERDCAKAVTFLEKYDAEIQADLSELCGEPILINLNSPAQLRTVLFDKLGMKGAKLTETGLESTGAIAMEALSKRYPVVRKILDLKEVKTLITKFLDKYPKNYQYAPDGFSHPNYLQCNVISGRFAVSEPNVQQSPKEFYKDIPDVGETKVTHYYELDSGDNFYINFREYIIAPEDHYMLGFDYCLDPKIRVLTSDLRWVALSDVEVGDELIGFDEEITYRGGKTTGIGNGQGGGYAKQSMKPCIVERKVDVVLPSYLITLDDGTTIKASEDHYWIATDKKGYKNCHRNWGKSDGLRRRWLKTSELNTDCVLHRWVTPWENTEDLGVDSQLDMAYLAGFADGEGWVTGGNVGFGQLPGPVWEYVRGLLKKHEFQWMTEDFNKGGVARLQLSGLENSLRFLGQSRPVRLLDKSKKMWEGTRAYSAIDGSGKGRVNSGIAAPRIVKIEKYVHNQPLVAIRTSSGTFIAEGFFTHNSQIELRVLAGEAQEPYLIAAFENDEDIHKAAASLMFNIPMDDVTKLFRDKAKTLQFALLYQMGVKSLADRLALSRDEAQSLYDKYFASFSSVAAWIEQATEKARKNGYSESRFGRQHRIWDFQSNDHWIYSRGDRLAVNAPIQGQAADMMKVSMAREYPALKKAGLLDKVHLVMNIHDALEYYVHVSVDPREVITALFPAVVYRVPGYPKIKADWHWGYSWGSLQEIEVNDDGTVVGELAPLPERPARHAEPPKAVLSPSHQPQVARALATPSGQDLFEPEMGKRVVVQISAMPDKEQYQKFVNLLKSVAGNNEIVLETPQGELVLKIRSGLTPNMSSKVCSAFSTAVVSWGPEAVNIDELVKGLML